MKKLIDLFAFHHEKENYQTIISTIEKGLVFKGTNLWVLIFAILLISLGMNINSTTVIIAGMLISPLLGPVVGLGVGIGINHLTLLRKSIINYLIAAAAGLGTSALYFLISPINRSQSEILSTTSPTVYDVLIAFFGGLAGIIAITSTRKGNVIAGVAIATVLIPALCTAGYGLAYLQFNIFFSGIYLFIINTVFIAFASLLIVRFLKFPSYHYEDENAKSRANKIIWVVVFVTLLPSIYFAYDLVMQGRYTREANRFIQTEAVFPNDYLLQKTIDPKSRTITLVYGGEEITEQTIDTLRIKMEKFDLEESKLEVRQGFSYLGNEAMDKIAKELSRLNIALLDKEKTYAQTRISLDSITSQQTMLSQVFNEVKIQYPEVKDGSIQILLDKNSKPYVLALLETQNVMSPTDQKKLENWLKIRLKMKSAKLILD